MSTITTRAGKGSPLTNNEVDANFTNLNNDKLESADLSGYAELTGATFTGDVEGTEFIGSLRGNNIFKAQAGEALSKGDAVYISGISGNTPVVSLADADSAGKMPAFGLASDAASANSAVDIVTYGQLTSFDTSSFLLGDTLYVSNTPGQLTSTAPSGESSLVQNLGKVERVHATAGVLFVAGAGRTNATPNLNDGQFFLGNGSNQAVSADFTTSVLGEISAGTGIGISASGVISNTDPDQTVSLTGGTGISTSGTYPNFTITNDSPDQTVSLTGAGTTTVSGTYPNFTITGAGTTYTAGSGLSLTGTEFANTAPDQTVVLTGAGATSISGTYPNFTISSTDSNTTYAAGTGITLSGTTFSLTDTNAKLNLSGGTLTGTLVVNSTNDAQITLTSADSWTGIGFNDGAALGAEYIWHNGNNGTFAIGGGGSNVAGKKLHVDGGTTIGSTYDNVTPPTDGLNVQGDIYTNANLWLYNYGTDTHLGLYSVNNAKQRADSRNESTFARTHWYGVSDTGGTSNFRHAWYDGNSYVNVTAENDGVTFTGTLNPTQGYKVNGTTVIDSSRNLTNIGSISQNNTLSFTTKQGTWITANVFNDAIGWNASYGVYIGSNVGGTHYLRGNGNFTTGGNTYNLWHSGNDGSGSGLDADTVDGVQQSTFMRKTANSALNMGNYNITNVNHLTFNDSGVNEGLQWLGGNDWRIFESPDSLTNTSGNLQFTTGGTRRMTLSTGGSAWTSSQGTLWGASNDGSGSGLDADTVDGIQGSNLAQTNLSSETFDGGTSTTINIKCDDGGMAMLRANGDSQGTGALEVGQSNSYGGGISYNGDGSPSFVSGETADYITFYRLYAGTRTEVFNYPVSSNTVNFNSTPTVGGSIVWHAGNDGSGSGLDADLLDGVNSTGFVKQLADGTSPDYQTPSSRRVDPTTSNPTNAHHAISTFGNGGNVTGQLATHFQSGQAYTRGYNSSWSAWRLQWDSSNDGSGSGLDADLLDGLQLHTGRNNLANRVVRTDVNGYIQAGWINTTSGSTTGTNRIYASNDGYVRYVTPTTFRNNLGLWWSGNDGSGSGLDADLLDGQQGSSYLRSNADDTCTGMLTLQRSGNTSFSTPNIYSKATSSSGGVANYHAKFTRPDGASNGHISTNYYSTTYATTSDYRAKEDVQPMVDATSRLMALIPVNFQWKDSDMRTDGFLAHEVAGIVSDAVVGEKDAVDEQGNDELQALDQSKLVPLLVKTIQEQQAAIEALEARIANLES